MKTSAVLLVFGSSCVFAVIFALVVSNAYQQFDDTVFIALNSYSASAAIALLAAAFSELGSDIAEGLVVVLIYFLSRPNRRLAAGIAGAVLISDFVVFVLDTVYFRPRPFEVLNSVYVPLGKDTSSSFPSGHSTRAFAIVAAVGVIRGRRYVPALAIVAAAIALSRLLVGVHFPTDVIGGSFLGIAIGILAVYLADALHIVNLVQRLIRV